MSHPDPRHDPQNVHQSDSDERGFKFKKKSYTIKERVKKYKYGMNKPGNNVDRLLKALENKKK